MAKDVAQHGGRCSLVDLTRRVAVPQHVTAEEYRRNAGGRSVLV